MTVDVTGTWEGNVHSVAAPGGGGLVLILEQKGAKVVGTSKGLGTGGSNNAAAVEGTVNGDPLRFRDRRGAFTGELQVNGNDMTGPGTVQNWGPVTISLHRR